MQVTTFFLAEDQITVKFDIVSNFIEFCDQDMAWANALDMTWKFNYLDKIRRESYFSRDKNPAYY